MTQFSPDNVPEPAAERPIEKVSSWFDRHADEKADKKADNASAWSEDEIEMLRRLWIMNRTRHEISYEIKNVLGVDRTPKAVANKASNIGLKPRPRSVLSRPIQDRPIEEIKREYVPKPGASVKERICLSCSETFLSEGPGNRICTPCRKRSDRDIDDDQHY